MGLQELKTKWETSDRVKPEDVEGLSKKEIADITEELVHTVKVLFLFFSFSDRILYSLLTYTQSAFPKLNPVGPVKGPKLYSREIKQFIGYWEKTTGNSIQNPAYYPVLKQEISAIRDGMCSKIFMWRDTF